MRFLIATLIIISLWASGAVADEARVCVDPTQLKCARMQELIAKFGSLSVECSLGGSDIYHYDMFSCEHRKVAIFAYIISADKFFCPIGFYCQRRP